MSDSKNKSRFFNLQETHKPVMDGTVPRNGPEYIVFHNKFGQTKVSCILHWKDGFLHSTENQPAVQMDDSHTEYWTDGYLHNENRDVNGELIPAVIADYGLTREYWIKGKRIK